MPETSEVRKSDTDYRRLQAVTEAKIIVRQEREAANEASLEERRDLGRRAIEEREQQSQMLYQAAHDDIRSKERSVEETERKKPSLLVYTPALVAALLKDLLDLVLIGSFPGIGTVVTICFSILIFLLLLLTRSNSKLIDSRFLIRAGLVLILGSIAEGFIFGLNFLPIETITVFVIYLLDKNLSNEQITKLTTILAKAKK